MSLFKFTKAILDSKEVNLFNDRLIKTLNEFNFFSNTEDNDKLVINLI